MDMSSKNRKNIQWLLLVLLVVLVGMIALELKCWLANRASAFETRRRERAAFVDAVSESQTFDQLRQAGLFLPRNDGEWIVTKSNTGYQWGNWTLTVDSEGKWFETKDSAYALSAEVRSYIGNEEDIKCSIDEVQAPNLDPDLRSMAEDRIQVLHLAQQELYPYRIQHAPTLADARKILQQRGFVEVTDLPRPHLAGIK